jgi:hypothetical protein
LFTIAMFGAPVVVRFLAGAFGKEGDPRAAA